MFIVAKMILMHLRIVLVTNKKGLALCLPFCSRKKLKATSKDKVELLLATQTCDGLRRGNNSSGSFC